jgi:hypothetical protein
LKGQSRVVPLFFRLLRQPLCHTGNWILPGAKPGRLRLIQHGSNPLPDPASRFRFGQPDWR